MPIEINSKKHKDKHLSIKKDIAKQEAEELSKSENRIKSILAKIESDLSKGKKIKITQDMRELGIEDKVTTLIFKYSAMKRLAKICGFDDDSDTEKVNINLSSALE